MIAILDKSRLIFNRWVVLAFLVATSPAIGEEQCEPPPPPFKIKAVCKCDAVTCTYSVSGGLVASSANYTMEVSGSMAASASVSAGGGLPGVAHLSASIGVGGAEGKASTATIFNSILDHNFNDVQIDIDPPPPKNSCACLKNQDVKLPAGVRVFGASSGFLALTLTISNVKVASVDAGYYAVNASGSFSQSGDSSLSISIPTTELTWEIISSEGESLEAFQGRINAAIKEKSEAVANNLNASFNAQAQAAEALLAADVLKKAAPPPPPPARTSKPASKGGLFGWGWRIGCIPIL